MKTANFKSGVLFIFLLTVLLLFGCTESKKNEIVFGSILALTGDASSYGVMMKQGSELALEEINSLAVKSGQKSLRLLYEDSQLKPQNGITAYKKLVEVDRVNGIVNITGSIVALAIAPQLEKDKTIALDALSSSAKLSGISKNYFRIMPSDNYAGKSIADWAIQDKLLKGAIIYVNNEWGNGIKETAKKEFTASGGNLLIEESISAGEKNFRTTVQKVLQVHPEVIFLLVFGQEAVPLVKQLKESKIECKMIGSDNLSAGEFSTADKDITNGVYMLLPSEPESDLYKSFTAKFTQKYSEQPSVNSYKSYLTLKILYEAVLKTNGTDTEIRNYLLSLPAKNQYDNIKFNGDGDLITEKYTKYIFENGNIFL